MPFGKSLLESRLEFDYRVVMAMAESSPLIRVEAFANQHDLEKHRHPIMDKKNGGKAQYYLVHYNVRSLVGRGRFHKGFDVAFDLASMETYPEEHGGNTIHAGGITATGTSRPIPWSPHFSPGLGTVCLGTIWRGADHTLLVHVILHVFRLLNWDEPIKSGYHGWNPDAVKWWRNNLGAKPLTPGMVYPALPVELTHGISKNNSTDGIQFLNGPVLRNRNNDGFSIISPATPALRLDGRRNNRIVL